MTNLNCKLNKKLQDENLKKLIINCTYNIKGLTKKEIIEDLLPIKIKDMLIYVQDDRIIFEKNNSIIDDVWLDTNCYSNLEILKNITPMFGIKYTGDNLIELMKYKNKIILILL
jgi:hypothetical protein